MRHYCPSAAVVLVGTQIDRRDDSRTLAALAKNRQRPISHENGEKLAKKLKAACYVECSALTQVHFCGLRIRMYIISVAQFICWFPWYVNTWRIANCLTYYAEAAHKITIQCLERLLVFQFNTHAHLQLWSYCGPTCHQCRVTIDLLSLRHCWARSVFESELFEFDTAIIGLYSEREYSIQSLSRRLWCAGDVWK